MFLIGDSLSPAMTAGEERMETPGDVAVMLRLAELGWGSKRIAAERLAALAMAEALPAGHKTLGADKGYDTRGFVMELRELGITPHVAQNAYDTGTGRRRSAIDGRTTRHDGLG